MADRRPEVLARHLLLLSILFDNTMAINERAEMFLEVLGNTLVREKTAQYIASKCDDLIQFVTNEDGMLLGLVDLSLLRFKERDSLEDTLKSWRMQVPFEVQKLRYAV